MWEMVFWVTLLVLVYHYCGYPLVLMVLSRVRTREPIRLSDDTPSVSLIISVYNEEAILRQKIDNSLALDYPADKLEVIVASDGSTDQTCAIAREYAQQGVVLLHHSQRRGKTRTLNDVSSQAQGDILVFTDANGMYQTNALRKLIRPFADTRVGCACGELIYHNPNNNLVAEGYNHYWQYDQWLKGLESRLHSLLGSNGSIFAIRKELNEPLDPRISNDMVLPIKIAARGHAVLYVPEAISFEAGSAGEREELRRRSRIVARGLFGTLLLVPELLRKRCGFLLFQLFSRKLVRYFLPVLLAVLLIANCFLSGPFYRLTLAAQLLPYVLAPWGYYLNQKGKRIRLLSISYYFWIGVLAAAQGLFKVISFQELATWEAFDRSYDLVPEGERGRKSV